MTDMTMGTAEARFADIIWQNEPLSSSLLCKKSAELLGWKKSTTFTVLKRLCEKGIFQNEGGTVSSRISRTDFYAAQSTRFVEETFEGSLPAFLAAFVSRKRLTEEEIGELRRLIDAYQKEE